MKPATRDLLTIIDPGQLEMFSAEVLPPPAKPEITGEASAAIAPVAHPKKKKSRSAAPVKPAAGTQAMRVFRTTQVQQGRCRIEGYLERSVKAQLKEHAKKSGMTLAESLEAIVGRAMARTRRS